MRKTPFPALSFYTCINHDTGIVDQNFTRFELVTKTQQKHLLVYTPSACQATKLLAKQVRKWERTTVINTTKAIQKERIDITRWDADTAQRQGRYMNWWHRPHLHARSPARLMFHATPCRIATRTRESNPGLSLTMKIMPTPAYPPKVYFPQRAHFEIITQAWELWTVLLIQPCGRLAVLSPVVSVAFPAIAAAVRSSLPLQAVTVGSSEVPGILVSTVRYVRLVPRRAPAGRQLRKLELPFHLQLPLHANPPGRFKP